MKLLSEYLKQIHQKFEDLIQIATNLCDRSFQVTSEHEFNELQKQQEVLLSELDAMAREIELHYHEQIGSSFYERSHQQLEHFLTLNRAFVQNFQSSHRVIKFSVDHHADNDSLAEFLHLHKNIVSPDSSKTIKPEKKE